MEIFENEAVIIAIIFCLCFILFLIWITFMVLILKNIPNNKIDVLGNFFNKLPVKRLFNILSNNSLSKNEK